MQCAVNNVTPLACARELRIKDEILEENVKIRNEKMLRMKEYLKIFELLDMGITCYEMHHTNEQHQFNHAPSDGIELVSDEIFQSLSPHSVTNENCAVSAWDVCEEVHDGNVNVDCSSNEPYALLKSMSSVHPLTDEGISQESGAPQRKNNSQVKQKNKFAVTRAHSNTLMEDAAGDITTTLCNLSSPIKPKMSDNQLLRYNNRFPMIFHSTKEISYQFPRYAMHHSEHAAIYRNSYTETLIQNFHKVRVNQRITMSSPPVTQLFKIFRHPHHRHQNTTDCLQVQKHHRDVADLHLQPKRDLLHTKQQEINCISPHINILQRLNHTNKQQQRSVTQHRLRTAQREVLHMKQQHMQTLPKNKPPPDRPVLQQQQLHGDKFGQTKVSLKERCRTTKPGMSMHQNILNPCSFCSPSQATTTTSNHTKRRCQSGPPPLRSPLVDSAKCKSSVVPPSGSSDKNLLSSTKFTFHTTLLAMDEHLPANEVRNLPKFMKCKSAASIRRTPSTNAIMVRPFCPGPSHSPSSTELLDSNCPNRVRKAEDWNNRISLPLTLHGR